MNGQMTDFRKGMLMAAAGVIIISPDGLFMRLLSGAGTWDAIFFQTIFMAMTFADILVW